MSARVRIDSSLGFVLLIVLILGGTALFIYLQVRSDAVSEYLDREEQLVVLVTVVDDDERPLTTQVFIYEPTNARAAFFDVPGNTGAILRSLGRTDRIDELLVTSGIEPYRDRIADMLSISIPFYVQIGRSESEDLIDLLRGMDLFAADPVQPVGTELNLAATVGEGQGEFNGDLPTGVPTGQLRLEGPRALAYLDYEAADELDIDRLHRRQSFVQSLFIRLSDESEVLVEPRGLRVLESLIDTNMDSRALKSFITELGRLDTGSTVRQRIAGSYRTVEVDGEERELLFPHFEGQWVRETVSQVRDSLRAGGVTEPDADTIVIEVLNGTTTVGLARRTRDLYQRLGLFEVHRYDNADSHDYEHTTVIDRRGDGWKANRVAEVIRARNVLNEPNEDPNDPVDVTLILGQDFDGRYVRQ